jgi:hypothetical protein
MATQVKHRRGTQSEIDTFTPALGEVVVNVTEGELVLGDGVTPGGEPVAKKRNSMLSFDTLNDAVTNTALKTGYTVSIKNRDSNGGGSLWDVVVASSVTPNTYNIVQCTGAPALALVLKPSTEGVISAKAAGFIADNSTDNRPALEAIKASISGIVEIFFDFGTYAFSQIDLLDTNLVLRGINRRTTFAGIAGSSYSDFVQLGSSSQIFTGSYIAGIKLEGVSKQQTGMLIKNLTDVEFDVEMTNFSTLVNNLGGLSYQFKNFKGSNYNTGFKSRKSDPSDTVTVYNNHIQFLGQTQFTGGVGKAVDHDDGYGLYLEKPQIDFCGTTGNVATGGVFIGPNTGSELSTSVYPALIMRNSVLEGVAGRPLYVQSGSVVIEGFSGFGNEDKYVFETNDAVLTMGMVDATGNGQIEIVATNNKAVFINTLMTNDITGIGGGATSDYIVKINSGTGASAQNGFIDLALQSLYAGSTPANKLSDATFTLESTLGGTRRAGDPAIGADSLGYMYVRNNNYASQDGWRNRARSHAWHTHTNAFQMGVNESGDVTANSFTPFTGVHYFHSDVAIEVGLAVDLVDFSPIEVTVTTDAVYDDTSGEIIELDQVNTFPFKTNGAVAVSAEESRICAGVVQKCELIDQGYLVYVAAVGDNYAGDLTGFKVEGAVVAGDILCTGKNGKMKVAPLELDREIVTFKAMSKAINGECYGYF